MRPSFFALLVAIAATSDAMLVARQSLPTCAVSCIANANTSACPTADDSCLCTDQAFLNSTTTCIESSCSGSDLANAEAYAQQLCLAVGVTLTTVPTATANASSTATSTASTSAPSSSSTSGALMTRTGTLGVLAGAIAAFAIGAVL